VQGTHYLTSRGLSTPVLAALALLALSPAASPASPLEFKSESPVEILLAQRAIADSSALPTPPVVEPVAESDADTEPAPQKSIAKAFFMNLAVPGAGHIYAGKKRGWAYLGLEVAAWVGYLHYHDLGKQRETEFENYADSHWELQRWYDSGGQWQGTPEDSLILYFYDHNKQQYYEDIGKISTYWPGWDSEGNRSVYRGIRARSNNFLKNANIAVAGAFVNRIVSAADLLHSMKKHGASLDANTKLRFNVHTKPFSKDNAIGLVLVRRI